MNGRPALPLFFWSRCCLFVALMLGVGATSQAQQSKPVAAAGITRPSDTRPQHDDALARSLGIERYESKRLLLYTDIDPEIARTLPPLVDEAYVAWTQYFGPLPADPEGAEFQITGYLMRDLDHFRDCGMLQEDRPTLLHGRHRGAEFWMRDQDVDYYREHLVLHEATHCFMTIVPGQRQPLWYLEGMAEFFGVHQRNASGHMEFGRLPLDPNAVPGFGRIAVVRRNIREHRVRALTDLLAIGPQDFTGARSGPYAWSWALCTFLDGHPRYRDRFHELAHGIHTEDFAEQFDQVYAPDRAELATEWGNYTQRIAPGFDFEREAISFQKGDLLASAASRTVSVSAANGWQPTGVRVEARASYDIVATGQVTLATTTKPWLSGPEGITIEYAAGKPIGRLLGVVIPEGEEEPAWDDILDLAAKSTITPDQSGTLFLRVNDFSNLLGDNTGAFDVRVTRRP